jgi:hypothetical protein
MIQCSTSSNAARKLHAVAIFAIQPDQFNRATTHRTSLQIPCQEQSPTHRSSPANHHRPATLLPQWPSEAQRQPSLLPTSGHRTVQSLSRSKVTQFFTVIARMLHRPATRNQSCQALGRRASDKDDTSPCRRVCCARRATRIGGHV